MRKQKHYFGQSRHPHRFGVSKRDHKTYVVPRMLRRYFAVQSARSMKEQLIKLQTNSSFGANAYQLDSLKMYQAASSKRHGPLDPNFDGDVFNTMTMGEFQKCIEERKELKRKLNSGNF